MSRVGGLVESPCRRCAVMRSCLRRLNQVAESQGNGAPNGTPGGQYVGPRAIDPVQEHSHDDDPDFITRTRFLSGVAIAGGAVLSAAILVPIVGFAVSDSVKSPSTEWVDIGPVSNFPAQQTTGIAVTGQADGPDARAWVRNNDGQLDRK